MAQHWGRRGANSSESEDVRSKCKKSGENSRQMAPVSTICDEYCRNNHIDNQSSCRCGANNKNGGEEVKSCTDTIGKR